MPYIGSIEKSFEDSEGSQAEVPEVDGHLDDFEAVEVPGGVEDVQADARNEIANNVEVNTETSVGTNQEVDEGSRRGAKLAGKVFERVGTKMAGAAGATDVVGASNPESNYERMRRALEDRNAFVKVRLDKDTIKALEGVSRKDNPEKRKEQLEKLPHEGYSEDEIEELRGIVEKSGLPVDKLTRFVRAKDEESDNAGGKGKMNTIASMHTHGPEAGTFTTHKIFHDRKRMTDEGRASTVVHEMQHSYTAFRPENAYLFGGEEGRKEVVEYVEKVALQSLATKIHLNGYHKHLMAEFNNSAKDFAEGKINDTQMAEAQRKLNEETQAILSEMAMFKRHELADVQQRQAQKLADLARMAQVQNDHSLIPDILAHPGTFDPKPVELITDPNDKAQQKTGGGADMILIKLLSQTVGVDNVAKLQRHINIFKGKDWVAKSRNRK